MKSLDLVCNELEMNGERYSQRDFQEFLSRNPQQKPIHLGFLPSIRLNKFDTDELSLYCVDESDRLNRFDFSIEDTTKPLRDKRIKHNPTIGHYLSNLFMSAIALSLPTGLLYLASKEKDDFVYGLAGMSILMLLPTIGCFRYGKYERKNDSWVYQQYKKQIASQ